MSITFSPQQGLIVIGVELFGPTGSAVLKFALDTGATKTMSNAAPLIAIGYDPILTTKRVQVTTGSGIEFASLIEIERVNALGQKRTNFPVLCYTLPASTNIDGLLGLDFFRSQCLTVDFRVGQVTLN